MTYPCPVCGSRDTSLAYAHQDDAMIEQVWLCGECPHETVVQYGDPEVVSVKDADGEAVDPAVYV